MIIFSIVVIAIISIVFSLLSLRHELKKSKHEKHVTEELGKGKVLFYSPSDESTSSL